MPTNVAPSDLNYCNNINNLERYDEDIARVIPFYEEVHICIEEIIKAEFVEKSRAEHKTKSLHETKHLQILELGIGTGITSERILKHIPHASYICVDFSAGMIERSKTRLTGYDAHFINSDYAVIDLPKDNDAVVSVISIHHQETDEGKIMLFKKIYDSLIESGVFIYSDLVTYRDERLASLNNARHYHYLVEHIKDEVTLREWTYHHNCLNKPAPLEDQLEWLSHVGFKEVKLIFNRYNTALILARK